MFKKILNHIFLSVVLFTCFDTYAQNNDSSYKQVLSTIVRQFGSKEYDSVIKNANIVLFDNTAIKDSCYFAMLKYKALAYNWKNENDSAVVLFKNAIELSKCLNIDKSLRANLYTLYLNIAHPGNRNNRYDRPSKYYEEEVYRDYSIQLLSLKKNISNDDLDAYSDGFHRRCHNNIKGMADHIDSVIERDKYLYSRLNTEPFISYFAQIQADEYASWDFIKASTLYFKAINGYRNYLRKNNNDYIELQLYNCYSAFADLAYNHGYVEAAVEYYKNYIDWRKNKGNYYIVAFGDELNMGVLTYIAYLQAANRYEDVKNYCDEIIRNPYFNDIKIDTSDYLSKLYDYKDIVLTISKNPHKKINPISLRYDDEIYQNINNDDVDYCIPYIYSDLYIRVKNKQLNYIWNIEGIPEQIDAINKYLRKKVDEFVNWVQMYDWNLEPYYESLYTKETINTMLFEDGVVIRGRHDWTEDGMGLGVWLTCHRLASIYFYVNDYNNAVKWQQIATDIVDINYDTWDNMDLYNMNNDNIGITHINTAFYNYRYLALYCKEAKQYDKSLEYYSKAVNIYMAVLQKVYKGSDIYKEQVWENHKKMLSNIASEIIPYCDEYPPFGDLALELTILQKGFLAWQRIALRDAVNESNNNRAKSLYDKKLNLEKEIELSYYKNNNTKDRAALFGNLAVCEEELRRIVGTSNILGKTIIKVDELKKSLNRNDVFVDYFEVPVDTIVNFTYDFVYLNDDYHKTIQLAYEVNDFYAILMRKDWQHPKAVCLGRNNKTPLSELVVYNLNDKDIKTEKEQLSVINHMYRDTTLTHFIWDSIISIGNIKNNENIYYTPTSIFTKLGLENLSLGNNNWISTRYNVYRLSSARELFNRKNKISNTDVCLGIGDLYYGTDFEAINSKNKKTKKQKTTSSFAFNMYKRRNTSHTSLFNRNDLKPLSGTQSELRCLNDYFGDAAVTISGTDGTETIINYHITSLKPSILHIGTHGFNCINSNLSPDEEQFLLGNRDSYVSPMENTLYRTGLYLSVSQYLNVQKPSEGILTAKELSMMDLSHTKLVILSACSSAAGTVNSEGVYGLQRGLKIAGAESLIVSLWDVNDRATELLMKEFYRQLSLGKTRMEALLKAQEFVRSYDADVNDDDIGVYKTFAAPYYWAGFILIDGNE